MDQICNNTDSHTETLPPIRGFIPNSLNEWRGHISAVFFLPGCNLRCPFCHGWRFVTEPESLPLVEEEELFAKLAEHKGWLDGGVVTGGEPTLHAELPALLRFLREEGLETKLETNGTRPEVLGKLLQEELLNAVALDFKAILQTDRLANACRADISVTDVDHSIRTVAGAGVEVELHTTLCPECIELDELTDMANYIREAAPDAIWVIQQYNPGDVLSPEIAGERNYPEAKVKEAVAHAETIHNSIELRGF